MPSHTIDQPPQFTLQEQALATAMLRSTASATINFAINDQGTRVHKNPELTARDYDVLVTQFRMDPKFSLANARESLFEIAKDARLTPEKRQSRLSRYVDAYIDLTLKLDHAAFPPTKPGEVKHGIPVYIPDGLVDMGGESNLNAARRGREMIVIDKKDTLRKHKDLLMSIFSNPENSGASDRAKWGMFEEIGKAVYRDVPYEAAKNDGQSGYAKLSEYESGVCRHQALVFQTLSQAVGLTSRLSKNHVDFHNGVSGRHSSNVVRVNYDWFVFDATNPDYVTEDDKHLWRPGILPIGREPYSGQVVDGHLKHSGDHRTYKFHSDMSWHIIPPAS